MAVTDEQRARLRLAKLTALARAADPGGEPGAPLLGGAVLTALPVGDALHVLVEDPTPAAHPTALSAALLTAVTAGAERVVVHVDGDGADLARLAGRFTLPVEVRAVDGASSRPVGPGPVPSAPEPVDDPTLRALLEGVGVDVVVDRGVVLGEVLGLEVARLVVWPSELGGDDLVHLEAGVGRFDRDVTAAMHQGETPAAALDRAVGLVRAHRYPGAPTHPLTLLARERWLRAALVADPAPVGAAALEPLDTTVAPGGIKDPAPAAAVGTSVDGAPVVVVAGVGSPLSLVPVAADTRAVRAPGAGLVLAVPARDHLRSLDTLAGLVAGGARVVELAEPWGSS